MRIAEVVHAAPEYGLTFTPCCDRTLSELMPYDRISRDRQDVTCGRLTDADVSALLGAPITMPHQNTEQLLFEMALSVRSLSGSRITIEQAYQHVRAAVDELCPARSADEHWPASLMVRITTRAGELAS
jgi:hypothetical protein